MCRFMVLFYDRFHLWGVLSDRISEEHVFLVNARKGVGESTFLVTVFEFRIAFYQGSGLFRPMWVFSVWGIC